MLFIKQDRDLSCIRVKPILSVFQENGN